MSKNKKIKWIIVGKKWFDKVNGNTYHAARVYDLERHIVAAAPYEYGYGDQYIYSAFNAMKRAGVIDCLTLEHWEYMAICHENCKKIDLKYWGEVRL